ncbi:gliding motility-associated C-terminal domain-containing protein [Pontibacter roseus]|uniref:gliding motility-associated C-terminal domain-containing protein n=1 Tax=Pontibacter roseus TaxID=336989 RepID=UPI00037086BF|nr:T9SS C-terminal target domain-containing protein [Pontibacter roseus]
MRLRILLLVFLLLLSLRGFATHIVGGEFEMEHRSGFTYRITLNLYFDDINGSPGALDPSILVRIFDKQSNRVQGDVRLPLRSDTYLTYTDIACTTGELRTRRLVYYQDVILPANVFSSPQGYYMVWERCCRNMTINNIQFPGEAAQAFYMEFPAITSGGVPFVNSSPRLFSPLSDYACANELFYYDFSGTDTDGDSLVYDMVTPLNGFSSSATGNEAPLPRPGPYPEVRWLPGYGSTNQIQGSPPIRIEAQTGRLTVRPASKGLFVFGVRVQEFRNGIKIGEVRRDFQLLVKDCPRNDTPAVVAKVAGQKNLYRQGEVLRITPDDARCLNIVFTDADPSSSLTLYARPVNFNSSNYTFSGVTTGVVNTTSVSDSLKATLCFAECFDTEGKVYRLDLIVKDNGCSLPKQDTLQVSFVIEPIPNAPPTINLSKPDRVFFVEEGDVIDFDVLGFDPDEEEVTLSAAGKDFDIKTHQIEFENRSGVGRVTSPFSWQIDCQALQKKSYQIEFTVTSVVCEKPVTRTELIEVRTNYPNNIPVLTTDKEVLTFELELNEAFEAKFNGTDLDLHQLGMAAAGEGFTLEELGMKFTSIGGNGTAQGLFSWVANCNAFNQEVTRVTFFLKENACVPSPDQTITMEFRVKVPNLNAFVPPNIFTPNGDGLNDYFEVPGLPADVCTGAFDNVKIYNRWGKEVFASTNTNFKWDGKGVNDGVYFYVIDYRSERFKGSVTLVR